MTRMNDVARVANVSAATVSRVLSNNRYVSQETRRKVLEAVEQLGYKPNRLASNFRKMTSRTVIVVMPGISNPFFAQILKAFNDVARHRGYHVLLGDTGNDLNGEREFIELVKAKFVDGVLLATARIPKEEIAQVSEAIPVVLACEYIDGFAIPTVAIDNVGAARAATQYLISLGHRQIAHLSGPLSVVLGRDRLKGYRQALLANEIPVDEAVIREGDFSVRAGYELTRKLLAMQNRPTAVFAANDEMAIGAMRAAKELGLSVPAELSVVGFDDIPLSTLVEPTLTTIRQPKYEIGTQSMNMLLDLIEGGENTRQQVVLEHELVVRDSTSGPKKTQGESM